MKKILILLFVFFGLYNFASAINLDLTTTSTYTSTNNYFTTISYDGNYMYEIYAYNTTGTLGQAIYSLSTPYDLSTRTLLSTKTLVTGSFYGVRDGQFYNNGNTLIAIQIPSAGSAYYLVKIDMSTPYDISTGTVTTKLISSFDTANSTSWGTFSQDGLRLYWFNATVKTVKEFTLSTAFDISSLTTTHNVRTLSSASSSHTFSDFLITTDGTEVLTISSAGNINSFELSTPYDFTTASYIGLKNGFYKNIGSNTNGSYIYAKDSSNILSLMSNTDTFGSYFGIPALITSTGSITKSYFDFSINNMELTASGTAFLYVNGNLQESVSVIPNTPFGLNSDIGCYIEDDTHFGENFVYNIEFRYSTDPFVPVDIITETAETLDFTSFLNSRGYLIDEKVQSQTTAFSWYGLNSVNSEYFNIFINGRYKYQIQTEAGTDRNMIIYPELQGPYLTYLIDIKYENPEFSCFLFKNESFGVQITIPPYAYESGSGGTGTINITAPDIEDTWNSWDTNLDGELSIKEMATGAVGNVKTGVINIWDFIVKIMNVGNVTPGQNIMGFFIPSAHADLVSDFNAGMESTTKLNNIIDYIKYGILTILFFIAMTIFVVLIVKSKKN